MSGLTLLLGGAGSGKSRLAVRLAQASGLPVAFVATAEARDPEMAERIERHRRERPEAWLTVEEPVDLRGGVARVPASAFLVIDCLTLWTANLLDRGWARPDVAAEAEAVASLVAGRPGPAVAVSNEVGLGIVPASELGRRFRDVLGQVNAVWAEAADAASLVVAGRLLRLERDGV